MVLFTSGKNLTRAENIKAVYDAYDGGKEFYKVNPYRDNPILRSSQYHLRVTDEFITASPGKAVMIGHGIDGGKTVGLDQPHPYHRKENAKLIDAFVCASEWLVPMVARMSGVPEERVLPLGVPRTDAYFTAKRTSTKRTYLYAPTYRSREETPMPGIDWQMLDEALSDNEELIVKPHMLTPTILVGKWRHIREVSRDEPSAEYLINCDVLITDYSSIMFDAMLLKKPVVLFEKDPGYLRTRGMYLRYPEEYTTRYATNEAELLDLIKAVNEPNDVEKLCVRKLAGACDGSATLRVVQLIHEIQGW